MLSLWLKVGHVYYVFIQQFIIVDHVCDTKNVIWVV